MHIAFKFNYIHDNGLFTALLNRILELATIPVSLHEDVNHYRIEATGEQAQLEALAEQISSLVPQSLYLREYTIEEMDAEDASESLNVPLPPKNRSYQIPCCPECQRKVIETYDPFIPCSVCGFSDISLAIGDLEIFTEVRADTQEAFFMKLADILMVKGELTLPTFNGIRRFSFLNTHEHKSKGILSCNPVDISDKFLITQGELDALMMVEKPTVRLKAKLKLRTEFELNAPFYPVFFADDKITLALSTVLNHKGIDAVFCDHVPRLRVAAALDEHMIISMGRDMLPWKNSLSLKNASFCEYAGIQAFGDSDGLVLDTKLDVGNTPFIPYVSNEEKTKVNNAIRFESAHAALRSIVLEKGLEGDSLCGIYLSREHPSHIFSFASKIGYTPMVLFHDDVLFQPKTMMTAIAEMDEGGLRLVSNFKNSFPELYKKVEQVEFNSNGDISDIAKLWSLAAVFIGIYDGCDAVEACETLESIAIEFGGKSGPRIDYKIISTDEGYQLDYRLAIRSAMSFKLAGLDDYLLSFGFIDSLADFIAMKAEDSDANIGIDGVALSGSLFENRQLLMRTYNALSANYKIYRNECLSSDGANVALGAITLGSE